VRDGHERAFEALVNRYRRPLLGYCRRLSLSEARAEDVLQQALLKTWIALRDGAEVRDIKAWLYRVVHNTAVNAVRDAAHDRERLADPTLRAGIGQADLERGLVMREALAEVAALPRLQREAIVRTAVGGHSHEQVASDLGITDGAVRGLLYRARATLRTATTAVTPVSWLSWFAGRAEQSAPASERLSELAAGGGTAGLGGLLLKGTVVAVTAGTLLTGAAVVRLQAHHAHHKGAAATSPHGASAAVRGTRTQATAAPTAPVALVHHDRSASRRSSVRVHIGRAHSPVAAAPGIRHLVSAPAHSPGVAPRGAPAPSVPVGSTQGDATSPSSSSAPSGSSGQTQAGASGSGAGGASGGGPVGSAAGSSSSTETASGTGTGDAPASSESESAGGSTPSSESSGTQSGTGASESSGATQSGGLVGTVVHEVGSLLEHVLG
jgi:RNA polymerase sigma factor (sigma-70 family)